MLNVILIVHKYRSLDIILFSSAWRAEPLPHQKVTELPHLQLFLLEEDLSIHGVWAGGCGVRAAGGWRLLPRSDKLQLCVRQAVFM